MEEITNHNCANLCCEKFCDEVETEFMEMDINGMKIFMGFCPKHAEEFENKFWERSV